MGLKNGLNRLDSLSPYTQSIIIIEHNVFLGLITLGIELDNGVRSREDPCWDQNNNQLINQNRLRNGLVN